MARRRRQEKPPRSNRGRPDARGVFVIFERDEEPEATEEREQDPARDEDEPLARDDGDGDAA